MTARSSPKIIWTVETDVFDQTARVAKEIGDGAAPSLPSDPGQRANLSTAVSLYFAHYNFVRVQKTRPSEDDLDRLA
jgi:hypothetical protein